MHCFLVPAANMPAMRSAYAFSGHSQPALLSEKEVATLLRVSTSWLQKRRVNMLPPAYIKVGAMVRYELSAIEAFITACASQTSDRNA